MLSLVAQLVCGTVSFPYSNLAMYKHFDVGLFLLASVDSKGYNRLSQLGPHCQVGLKYVVSTRTPLGMIAI